MEVFWELSHLWDGSCQDYLHRYQEINPDTKQWGEKGAGGNGFWDSRWKQLKVTTAKMNQFGTHKSCQQHPNTGTPSRQQEGEVCGVGMLG